MHLFGHDHTVPGVFRQFHLHATDYVRITMMVFGCFWVQAGGRGNAEKVLDLFFFPHVFFDGFFIVEFLAW